MYATTLIRSNIDSSSFIRSLPPLGSEDPSHQAHHQHRANAIQVSSIQVSSRLFFISTVLSFTLSSSKKPSYYCDVTSKTSFMKPNTRTNRLRWSLRSAMVLCVCRRYTSLSQASQHNPWQASQQRTRGGFLNAAPSVSVEPLFNLTLVVAQLPS